MGQIPALQHDIEEEGMPRLPTMPFERPMPDADYLEESGFPGDHSAPQSHIKLGVAWLCATLAGIGALVYSTMSQYSGTATMLGLIVLLVAYAAYGYSLKKKNTLQFADSLYYMGFLWALFALIATFVLWPAPKLTSDTVLTTFGYALISTFCGMLLRLLTIQFQATLPDRLVHAEETIDRRVATLMQQLNEATRAITSFKDRAAGDLGGALHELVRSLADVRASIAEQHRTMTTTLSAGFESSVKDVLGRLAAIQIPQEILTTEVAKLIAALGKREDDFEEAAQRLDKSLMQAATTVGRFGDSLYESEAAKRVGVAVTDLSRTIKERTDEFAGMSTALQASRAELESQLNSLQAVRSEFGMVSTQLSTLEAELRDLSLTSISADVRNGLMNVQDAIRSSLDATKAIESTMRGVMFFLRERVTEERSNNGN
jgi:predicted  nucleic acid-binding Zn-ribbon protein